MTDYAIDVLDNLVREELPAVIHESLPEIAPIYNSIQNTFYGVKMGDGIGRNWEVEHLFGTGVAGLMQSSYTGGPAMRTNTNYPQGWVLDSTSAHLTPFPNAVNAPHTGSIKRTLALHKSTGNFSVPVTWRQGDALSASQIKQVSRDIKAVGQLRALTEAQSFFMSSKNALCQIDNYDSAGEASGYFEFTVKSGTGRTQFFRPGMLVDVYYDNSGAPNWGSTGGTHYMNIATANTGAPWSTGYIPLIVASVNYISGVIRVASVDGTHLEVADLTGDAAADDDWIVMANCGTTEGREMRTWGLEDWIAESGGVFPIHTDAEIAGGASSAFNVTNYPQFASNIVGVSGVLTETVLNNYIGGFLDAYPGSTLDTIITTMGVTLKYLEQPSTGAAAGSLQGAYRLSWDRTNKPLNYASGWSDISYSFNGRDMRWIISPMCLNGYLYALKLQGGNIQRYVPPPAGNTNQGAEIGGDVEFLAPLGGHSSVFMVGRQATTAAPMDMLEAPFWQYGLVAPIDIRCVKLTGLTEATMA